METTLMIRRYANDATGTYAPVPTGWSILRSIHETHAEFDLFERNGATWQDGTPRAALTVTVYHATKTRGANQVSWPSTSDKRPVLARCLAVALLLAAEYAEGLSNQPTAPAEEPDRIEFLRALTAYGEATDSMMEMVSLDQVFNDVMDEIPADAIPDDLKRDLINLGFGF